MVYRTKLEANQVKEVKDHLRTLKCMEILVDMCERESICKRMTVYTATNPETYDPENVVHRNVSDAAVRLMHLYNVYFEWDTECPAPYSPAPGNDY